MSNLFCQQSYLNALKYNGTYPLFLFANLLLAGHLLAQQGNYQSNAAIHHYQQFTGYGLRLYNGTEYIRTYHGAAGHPFLISDTMQQGIIAYEGVVYTDVQFNYDIVRDLVIVKGPQLFSIQLISGKLDSFSLGTRRFQRYDAVGAKFPAGFYEVLYSGEVKVLARREKRIPKASRQDDTPSFEVLVQYYVQKKDQFYLISGKNEILSAFADKRAAMKTHLKSLDFRKAPEAALIEAATFYDEFQN